MAKIAKKSEINISELRNETARVRNVGGYNEKYKFFHTTLYDELRFDLIDQAKVGNDSLTYSDTHNNKMYLYSVKYSKYIEELGFKVSYDTDGDDKVIINW